MARTRSKRGTAAAKRRNRTDRRSKAKVAAAAAVVAASTSPLPQSVTLQDFATLAYEIKTHILELACSPLPSTSRFSTAHSAERRALWEAQNHRRDFITTLNLMVASREFHGLVAQKLHGSVWLARPSSLTSFHLAITSHPALGSFVKSFHVGPEDEPSGQYNPLQRSFGRDPGNILTTERAYIRTSLQSKEDAELLPRWYSPELKWPIHHTRLGVRAEIVGLALDAAQRIIDIDLSSHSKDFAGRELESGEYTVRMWEVQAALDLYLIRMRRWEDEHGLPDAPEPESEVNPPYPHLVLAGYTTSLPRQDERSTTNRAYILHRSAILQHLTRRKACTDRFDHPLIFARSGVDIVKDTPSTAYSSGRVELNISTEAGRSILLGLGDSSFNYLLPSTATIGSLLGLLRSTLSLTPNIENLSLMGFLELAIPDFKLDFVRSLSIGPPAPRLYDPLRLDGFAKVEELRICRNGVQEANVDEIIANMPRLRRLRLSQGERYTRQCLHSFAKVENDTSDGSSQTQATKTTSTSNSNAGSSIREGSPNVSNGTHFSHGGSLPLIEMLMHGFDRRELLEEPDSATRRNAWTSGLALPDQQRRLLIAGSGLRHIPAAWGFANSDKDDLYDEGRVWWEEHRGGNARWSWA